MPQRNWGGWGGCLNWGGCLQLGRLLPNPDPATNNSRLLCTFQGHPLAGPANGPGTTAAYGDQFAPIECCSFNNPFWPINHGSIARAMPCRNSHRHSLATLEVRHLCLPMEVTSYSMVGWSQNACVKSSMIFKYCIPIDTCCTCCTVALWPLWPMLHPCTVALLHRSSHERFPKLKNNK